LVLFLKGLNKVEENLFVFTPVVIPFHRSQLVRKINRMLFVFYLWIIQKYLRLGNPVYIVFNPSVYPLIEFMRPTGVVYYCIDELSGYREVDKEKLLDDEQRLLANADCVISCSHKLADLKKPFNKHVYYVPHGVDWKHFRRALDNDFQLPRDLIEVPRPILGFLGSCLRIGLTFL
jgi:hypothetical protein